MSCRALAFAWMLLGATAALACGSSIPDPGPVVARFAKASRAGDHQAIYRLLSKDAQRSLGAARVKQLVAEQRTELNHAAAQLTAPAVKTEVTLQARFIDGDTAMLKVEGGDLRVESAAALPSHASTPEQALVELRAVLLRRSYPGLLNVLSRNSAAEFEAHLQSLVSALADAPAFQVEVEDDRAVINLPHGHKVELRKEAGLWKVHDFE